MVLYVDWVGWVSKGGMRYTASYCADEMIHNNPKEFVQDVN